MWSWSMEKNRQQQKTDQISCEQEFLDLNDLPSKVLQHMSSMTKMEAWQLVIFLSHYLSKTLFCNS